MSKERDLLRNLQIGSRLFTTNGCTLPSFLKMKNVMSEMKRARESEKYLSAIRRSSWSKHKNLGHSSFEKRLGGWGNGWIFTQKFYFIKIIYRDLLTYKTSIILLLNASLPWIWPPGVIHHISPSKPVHSFQGTPLSTWLFFGYNTIQWLLFYPVSSISTKRNVPGSSNGRLSRSWRFWKMKLNSHQMLRWKAFDTIFFTTMDLNSVFVLQIEIKISLLKRMTFRQKPGVGKRSKTLWIPW